MRKPKRLLTPAEKTQRLQQALFRLVGNDAFEEFMEELREQQHIAMLDAINDAVIKDERLSLAAAGEIRAYQSIISLYDDMIAQRLQQADVEAEQQAS